MDLINRIFEFISKRNDIIRENSLMVLFNNFYIVKLIILFSID